MSDPRKFFKVAMKEAHAASQKDEVPIGAVLVKDGKIISKAFNSTEKKKTFLAHAEILCIEKATKKMKSKYLVGCELYVTLEPCLMCQNAAKLSRIETIHYLLPSEAFGSTGKAYRALQIERFRDSSNELFLPIQILMKDFFKKKR